VWRVRELLHMNRMARILNGAWQRLHALIAPIFAALSISTTDLPICDVLFVDLSPEEVEPRLWCRGACMKI
jgi:hypothetical protein